MAINVVQYDISSVHLHLNDFLMKYDEISAFRGFKMMFSSFVAINWFNNVKPRYRLSWLVANGTKKSLFIKTTEVQTRNMKIFVYPIWWAMASLQALNVRSFFWMFSILNVISLRQLRGCFDILSLALNASLNESVWSTSLHTHVAFLRLEDDWIFIFAAGLP